MGAPAPPAAPPAPPSFFSKAWSAICTGFIGLNLILAIAGSIAIIYDPDTFCITPMMPDSDFRTACDKNYVCEALRGVLNIYAFALLLMSSLLIFALIKKPHLVRIYAFFYARNLGHLLAFARIAHLNLIFWNNLMIPFIVTFVLTFLHGLVISINMDLETPSKS